MTKDVNLSIVSIHMTLKAMKMDELTQGMSIERKEGLNSEELALKSQAVSSLCVGVRDHAPEDLIK